MNIQYNDENGISSQSLSINKKKIQTGNIPAGVQATITQFHILVFSIFFDRLS